MSRTLVVTTTFPQFPGDPRGEFLRTHWEGRAAAGETVRVLAPRTAWSRGEVGEAIEVRRFAYAPRPSSTLTGRHGILENIRERPRRAALVLALWPAMAWAVAREIARFGPDRVVAHMLVPAGWIVARACRRAGVPYVLYGHGTDVDVCLRLPGPIRRWFAGLLRGAAAIYVPSSNKRERLRRAMAADLEIGVETMVHAIPDADPRPRTRARQDRRPRILFLGRLIEQKGVDVLLRAAAKLDDPEVHVAGDGPLRARLERLAAQLGVDATFHGFVQGVAKQALLREVDVMCVPSRETAAGLSEGAPLVLREAQAHGLPVVASEIGGIPELCATHPSAWLVPSDDADALARALERALARQTDLRAVG